MGFFSVSQNCKQSCPQALHENVKHPQAPFCNAGDGDQWVSHSCSSKCGLSIHRQHSAGHPVQPLRTQLPWTEGKYSLLRAVEHVLLL